MVGVPRSKGCRICVQRRVKCDQTRPFCNNCKKGNRPCPGYGQDMKFQDEGPKLRQRYEHQSSTDADDENQGGPSDDWPEYSSSGSSSISRYKSPSPHKFSQWDATGLDVTNTDTRAVSLLGLMEHPGFVRLPGNDDFMHGGTRAGTLLSLGRLSFEHPFEGYRMNVMLFSPEIEQQQLLYTFASAMSPNSADMPAVLAPAMRHHGRWLSHLPELTGTNPLLDTSVRAVTLAHLGRLHGSQDLLNESRPFYGKALRLLNEALLDDEQGMASETLSATILLSFYEMFASDSNDSWVRHAGGAGTLMRIRGPARHRYGFDREIFLAYRHALVIEAFQHDIASFLNETEWRELSKQIHEDIRATNTIGDRLEIFEVADAFFMEMVKIPGLMCDARNIRNSQGPPEVTMAIIKDIIKRSTEYRTNIKSIFVRMSSALRNIGHAPTSYVSGDPIIPIYYKYVNIFVASSHTGYWSLLILLNILLREMDPSGEHANLYAMENREAALDCCRSEPYMVTSSFLGPFFVIFALRLALGVLEPKQEREWVIQKLFHIGNTNMAMAKHMPNFANTNKPMPRIRDAVEWADKIFEKPAPKVGNSLEELELMEPAE